MRGIVIWVSPPAQSALIAADGGANICFGTYNSATAPCLSVGDLVEAPGLRPGDTKFSQGLSIAVKGFLPEVANLMSDLASEPAPHRSSATIDLNAHRDARRAGKTGS